MISVGISMLLCTLGSFAVGLCVRYQWGIFRSFLTLGNGIGLSPTARLGDNVETRFRILVAGSANIPFQHASHPLLSFYNPKLVVIQTQNPIISQSNLTSKCFHE